MLGTEAGRSPRFLDSPCARAPLYDPGGTSAPDPSAPRCCLPPLSRRRLPQVSFEAQSRGPCTPCVRFNLPVTRHGATRGPGWWSALAGRDSHPLGCTRDFEVYSFAIPCRLGLALDRERQAPREPDPSRGRQRRRAARRRASSATRPRGTPRHLAAPRGTPRHTSKTTVPARSSRPGHTSPVPSRVLTALQALTAPSDPEGGPLADRSSDASTVSVVGPPARAPHLGAQHHDLAARRANQTVEFERPSQQHAPRRPPRASGAGLRQPHPDPCRRGPALRRSRPHRPVPPMPRRQHAAVAHLVRPRRGHEGDEPLGELLGRQLQRRRPVGPGALQRDANPVARERLDPVQRERWARSGASRGHPSPRSPASLRSPLRSRAPMSTPA